MRTLLLMIALVAIQIGRAEAGAPLLPPGVGPATDPASDAMVKQSLAVLPELAQARATVSAQRERAPQAGAWPDPTLQVGIQNDGFRRIEIGRMEASYVYITASQTFPWPGKQRLRSEVAELVAKQTESSVGRLRLSTEAEVRRAYLDLLLARDRLALLGRLEAIWKKSAASARTRYEAGRGAQSDVLRSQLELNRLRQRRWALLADERLRLHVLNRLRRRPLDEPIPTTARVADLRVPRLPDEKPTLEFSLAGSPELEAAKRAVSEARSSIALSRKGYWPDFTLTAGVMIRGGDFPPMWLLGLGGTIPIFAGQRQSRAEAEARARLTAAERNLEAIEQVLRLRVQQRRAALAATLDTVKLYREGLLVQSEATANSTLAQYEVGRASFASVLEANSGFIGDQDAYLQTLTEAQRVAISTGEISLDPVGAPSAGGAMGAAVPGAGGMGAGGGGGAGAAMPAAPAAAPGEGSSSSMGKM